MTNEDEFIHPAVEVLPNDTIRQQEAAMIDIQIATANKYPRNLTKTLSNVLAEVKMSKEVAEACSYSLKRGGKTISGPSVHLAKIVARHFKNCRIASRVIDVDETYVTTQGVFHDIENNIAWSVEVLRRITDRDGKRFNDDMIVVTANAGLSIATRQAIFAGVSPGIVDQALKAAQNKVLGIADGADFVATRTDWFKRVSEAFDGVKESDILRALGKQAISHVTANDLQILVGMVQAIKDGDSTVELTFKTIENSGGAANNTNANIKAALDEAEKKIKEKDKSSKTNDQAGDLSKLKD
jgi:hypothetical protein